MTVLIGNVYKNEYDEFLTPAMSGDFYICDMWPCDEKGKVSDIEENPFPTPKYTNDLVLFGKSEHIQN